MINKLESLKIKTGGSCLKYKSHSHCLIEKIPIMIIRTKVKMRRKKSMPSS